MTMMERLVPALKEAKIPKRRLCEALGLPPSTFYSWMNHGDIPGQYVMPICRFLNVTPQWLLEGVEELPVPDGYVHLSESERFVIDSLRAVDYEGQVVITNAIIQERRRCQAQQGDEATEDECVG